jgi:hypothetical protein
MALKKVNWFEYQPKLKVGDKVIDVDDGSIGIVRQIDNYCSDIYQPDAGYMNPGYKEYYIEFKNNSWVRPYCHEFDSNSYTGPDERLNMLPLTKATKLLYGKKKKKGQP